MKHHVLTTMASLVLVSAGVSRNVWAQTTCMASGAACVAWKNTDSDGYGVQGLSHQGTGIWGQDDSNGVGVYGLSANYIGVSGGSSVWGVVGTSTGSGGYGVYGSNTATSGYGIGVYGTAASATANGVTGENSAGGTGVYGQTNGTTSTSYGIYGVAGASGSGVAINAYAAGSATGVKATTSSGIGVDAVSSTGDAIYATSSSGVGVYGSSGSGTGIEGFGVYGTSGWGSQVGLSGVTTGTGSSDYGVWGVSGGGSSYAGYFTGNVYTTGSYLPSDRRLKKNIQPLTKALDQLMQLQGVTFEWKEPDDHGKTAAMQRGFIAQDVEKVFPDWIGHNGEGFEAMDLHQIESLEVESIRELKLGNDKLQADNDKLKSKLAELDDRLSTLEGRGHTRTSGIDFIRGPGGGWIFGGLALASVLVVSRRRRSEGRS